MSEVHDDYGAILTDLRALAMHLARGGSAEWSEPEPRGRKGPDKSRHRLIQLRIDDPAQFDALRWTFMTDPRFKVVIPPRTRDAIG
jgi:hypothetical protein